jgi:hypothetical protein
LSLIKALCSLVQVISHRQMEIMSGTYLHHSLFSVLFVNMYIVDHRNLGLLLPSLNIIRGLTGMPSVTIIVSAGSGWSTM